MAVDKMVDSTQLDASLASVADAIRTKGGTSGQLIFPNGFVRAILGISEGAGSFVPSEHLRTVTLPASVGKKNIFIFPMFNLIPADVPVRAHWGALILNGRTIMQGSTNSAKTAYVFTSTVNAESGSVNNADIFNSFDGSFSIVAAIDGNYGGVFVADKTYGYFAW